MSCHVGATPTYNKYSKPAGQNSRATLTGDANSRLVDIKPIVGRNNLVARRTRDLEGRWLDGRWVDCTDGLIVDAIFPHPGVGVELGTWWRPCR